jgi:hypothetical protein
MVLSNPILTSRSPALGPAPASELDQADRKRLWLAAALFGFAAIVQLVGMQIAGVRHMIDHFGARATLPHVAIGAPASFLALGLWLGRRLRVATIAFALVWMAFSVWAALGAVRLASEMPGAAAEAWRLRWFVPMVSLRSICFLGATLALGARSERPAPRIVGVALGVVFAVLLVAERVVLATLAA